MRYLIALLFLLSPAIGQDIFQPTGRYAEPSPAKHYLAMWTASYCGPCRNWKASEKAKIEAAGFRVVQYEMTKTENSRLYADASRGDRQIKNLPTFVWCEWSTGEWVSEPVVGFEYAEKLLPILTTQKPQPQAARLTRSQMIQLHNSLHGGGSWTWSGDLETHLKTVHNVLID